MDKTSFSVQVHHGKRPGPGTHWDFRMIDPKSKKVLSWAIPKQHMPSRGERVLAIWVDDEHSVSHMTFEGKLKNGDRVDLYDVGKMDIYRITDDRIVFDLHGTNIKGRYVLIKTRDKNWILLGRKNN